MDRSMDIFGERRVTIFAVLGDGGSSREALNAHRRRLGLGPSRNLISSGAPESPHAQEAVFPFLNTMNPARPYNDYGIEWVQVQPEPGHDGLLCSGPGDTEHNEDMGALPCQSEDGRGYSPARRYRGNRNLSRNRSANIPNEMNCRLWIAGLPPTCTVSELLREVRGVGPVYATHIVPPLVHASAAGTKVNIPTSAASLTFFTASAAHMFILQHSIHPFTVNGHVTAVSRHRIRTKPVPVDGQSRVLVITGDPEIVNPKKLASLFTEEWSIRFDTDFMKYTPGEESSRILWGFGSFRAQAQAVYIRLSQYPAGNIAIRYKSDPCA